MCLALVLLKHEADEPAVLHPTKEAACVRSRFCPAGPVLLPASRQRAAAGPQGGGLRAVP